MLTENILREEKERNTTTVGEKAKEKYILPYFISAEIKTNPRA